jgi:hypothetical protein
MLTETEVYGILASHPSLVSAMYRRWGVAPNGVKISTFHHAGSNKYLYITIREFEEFLESSDEWGYLLKWPTLKRLGVEAEYPGGLACLCHMCVTGW